MSQKEVIDEKDEQIQERNEKLEQTSERQSKGMLDIFDELRKDYSIEEHVWIIF